MEPPTTLIKPQTLKGFRDYLPETMIVREHLMESARRVFRSYGFWPIETPALEYSEILLGKGGEETDKQLFRFNDQGGRDVALRFDLTVPLARFVAQHANELTFPFKRYHVGTVWRAENPQRGRFREFVQCDFDVIGTTSNQADIETVQIIHDLFVALGFERFHIRVNHRAVLSGLLEVRGLATYQTAVLRALDKLDKQGADAVRAELAGKVGLGDTVAAELVDRIVALAERRADPVWVLDSLAGELASCPRGQEGVTRLREMVHACTVAGLGARLHVDIAIARGLEYYTGTVYETLLDDLPQIGSVCSGGRYDNLAGLYTRQQLPGVGASLGLDRLVAAMEELGLLKSAAPGAAAVLVAFFEPDRINEYRRVARALRAAGIAAEVYAEPARLTKQLKYAERKGHRLAVIAGGNEFARGVWQVKDLARRASEDVPDNALTATVKRLIAAI